MKLRKILLIVGCVLSQVVLRAQESMPQLGGLRAPAAAEWTVEYKYADQEDGVAKGDAVAKKEPRIRLTSVVKVDGRYHETIEMEDGTKRESWVFPDIQLIRDPQTKAIQRLLKSDLAASDYSQSDFPGLEWVSGKHPVKVIEEKGRRLYLLEIEKAKVSLTDREKWIQQRLPAMAKALEEQRRGSSGKATLTLDTASKQPVTFDMGNVVLTYVFAGQPVAPKQMEADFQAARDAWDKEMASMRRRTSQP